MASSKEIKEQYEKHEKLGRSFFYSLQKRKTKAKENRGVRKKMRKIVEMGIGEEKTRIKSRR